MRTLIHISDLHFGKSDPAIIEGLLRSFKNINPNLIIISGDLTQRARLQQFKDATQFLRELSKAGFSTFIIPGNHDISPIYHPLARLSHPYDKYLEHISRALSPTYKDEEIAIASINTVRPLRIKRGAVTINDLTAIEKWFSELSPSIIKIIVSHHPLDLPNSKSRKLAKRATEAIYSLAQNNIDIYLSGHYHKNSVVMTSLRYTKKHHWAIAVQAGTLSRRLRKEAQSFNVLTINFNKVRVDTYIWKVELGEFSMLLSKEFAFTEDEWRLTTSSEQESSN